MMYNRLNFLLFVLLLLQCGICQNVSVVLFNYVGITNTNIVVQTWENSTSGDNDISVEIIVTSGEQEKQLNVSGCLTNVSNNNPTSSSSSSTGTIIEKNSSSSGISSSLQSSSLFPSSSLQSSSLLPSSSLLSSSIVSSSLTSSQKLSSSSSNGVSSSTIASSSILSSSPLFSSSQGVSSSSSSSKMSLIFPSGSIPGFFVNTDFSLASNPIFASFNTNQTTQYTLYVDAQNGSDSNFGNSSINAFQTLSHVQSMVRLLLPNATNNILVYLNGIFTLSQTWTLSAMDSFASASSYFVTYTALNPFQKPVISGLYTLPKNWTLFNSTLNLYRLYVGSGFTTRMLVSNGTVAAKVKSNVLTNSTTPPYPVYDAILNTVNCSACGFPAIEATVETVWNFQFESSRCPNSTLLPNGTIVISPLCIWPQTFYIWYFYGGLISWIENAIFLFTPNSHNGQWALDSNVGFLYYQPRQGEIMNSIDVSVTQIDTLVETHPDISNIAFIGIEFAYTDWQSSSTIIGMGNVQADVVALSLSTIEYSDGHVNPLIPSGVGLSGTNILVTQCYFHDMFGGGLHFNGFVNQALCWNNTITHIGASGIQLGNIYYNNQTFSASQLTIQDNNITYIGLINTGSCGIFGIFFQDSIINYNDISQVPYSGIATGLGWIDFDPSTMQNNNQIIFNHVYNFNNGSQDGGGFYCNGHQPNTSVQLNFFHNSLTVFDYQLFTRIPSVFPDLIGPYDPPYYGPWLYQNWPSISPSIYLDLGCDGVSVGTNSALNTVITPYLWNANAKNTTFPSAPTYLNQLSSSPNTSIQLIAGKRQAPLHLLPTQVIVFGGMFDNINVNSITENRGCNSSYTATPWISGTGGFRNSTSWYCYKIITTSLGETPDYVFGGAYGQGYNGVAGYFFNNPYTNDATCPHNYIQYSTLGTQGVDFTLNYCVKPYVNGDPIASFGGFIGQGMRVDTSVFLYPNIFSSTWYCPPQFNISAQVYGAFFFDFNATLCVNSTGSLMISSSSTSSSFGSSSFSSSILGVLSSSSSIFVSSGLPANIQVTNIGTTYTGYYNVSGASVSLTGSGGGLGQSGVLVYGFEYLYVPIENDYSVTIECVSTTWNCGVGLLGFPMLSELSNMTFYAIMTGGISRVYGTTNINNLFGSYVSYFTFANTGTFPIWLNVQRMGTFVTLSYKTTYSSTTWNVLNTQGNVTQTNGYIGIISSAGTDGTYGTSLITNITFTNVSLPYYISFGGMWGYSDGVETNNIVTGGPSCNSTFTQLGVYGGYPIFLCYSILLSPALPLYTFGGFYGNQINNPFTAAQSCPSGFYSSLYYSQLGYNFYYCVRPYQIGDQLNSFGSLYAATYPNILSYGQGCVSPYLSLPAFIDSSSTGLTMFYFCYFNSGPNIPFSISNIHVSPVCYYPLAGNTHDYSGNGFNGISASLTSSGTFVTDIQRGIVYQQITANEGISTNCSWPQTFTIGVWYQNYQNMSGCIMGTNTTYDSLTASNFTTTVFFSYDTSPPQYSFYMTNIQTLVGTGFTTNTIDAGIWNHFIVTYNSTTGSGQSYLNGAVVGTISNAGGAWNIQTTPFANINIGFSNYFFGSPSCSAPGSYQLFTMLNTSINATQANAWYQETINI